jgi:pimeloyl-ACP methyl ester carboxylesterase
MPRLSVNGVELHYVEAGEGDPVLMIMGFGGDHLAWAFQVPALSARYRVITFDNRGLARAACRTLPTRRA